MRSKIFIWRIPAPSDTNEEKMSTHSHFHPIQNETSVIYSMYNVFLLFFKLLKALELFSKEDNHNDIGM